MEVLQHEQSETKSVMRPSHLSGHSRPSMFGQQPAAPRAGWWPTKKQPASSALTLAGIPFGPQMNGGYFSGSVSALASFEVVRNLSRRGRFVSLAMPNNTVRSFVAALLIRTHGFAAGRLPRRYVETVRGNSKPRFLVHSCERKATVRAEA